MRVLGLDVGDKYIGVAISDELGMFAQPLMRIDRISNDHAYGEIKKLIDEYGIKDVVVGLPINMNNTLGPQSEKVKKFAERLKGKFKINLIYIDERMSSISAERVLIEGSVRRENRKKYIDKIAASYILQTYLDMKQEDILDKYLFYDENNEPVEFILEGKFEINETPYVAMLPAKDLKGDIYILRIDKDMDGNEVLVGIEDDELEEAIEVYEELLSEKTVGEK